MQDIGCIIWINDVLQKVSFIAGILRIHSKLYHHYKEVKDQYNIQALAEMTPAGVSQNAVDQYGRPVLPRTAVMPCRMSPTPFASSESMLRSVLRSLQIFRRLTVCPDIGTNLFKAKDDNTRQKRARSENTIFDRTIPEDALVVYHILRLVLQYLLLFDEEISIISEVFPVTHELRMGLECLPLTASFHIFRRENLSTVSDARLSGLTRRVSLVTALHRVAFFLDIRSSSHDLYPSREDVSRLLRGVLRSNVFPMAENAELGGVEDGAVQAVL